ncbi:unnamed protein product [Pleuronectes platessa]|uniref:Uncharacterized protein n=1 Tax=Pleuronectes platessa TaxID=8262 RepID=A0A9N7Y824_PLEPL|nr:unnamed protein product [Pleuronectes platessa]
MFELSDSSVVGKQAGDTTLEHVGPFGSEAKQFQMWPAALNSHKQTKLLKLRVSLQVSEDTGEADGLGVTLNLRVRCHFLRWLGIFSMSPKILSNFYSCIESILVVKAAERITRTSLPSLKVMCHLPQSPQKSLLHCEGLYHQDALNDAAVEVAEDLW